MTRLLVCGSRDFADSDVVSDFLSGVAWRVRSSNGTLTLMQGGAKGADALADEWASYESGYDTERLQFDADWSRYGKLAGPLRNQRMLDEGKPDLVVAFVNKPLDESKGTKHMVGLARTAGVKTIVVEVR